ncbi:hypothetical protein HC864_05495 [Candidatus Gracilibacteria bacterium]|nr:hypothetical protein [Candidatus Gracilibacteria bacterium]
MTPIEYASLIKKWFWMQFSISLVAFFGIIFLLNPYDSNLYIWAFLISFVFVLFSALLLVALSFFQNQQSRILTISQINQLVYQSIISSVTFALILVLVQTNTFNIISMGVVLFCYVLYQLWANSQDN